MAVVGWDRVQGKDPFVSRSRGGSRALRLTFVVRRAVNEKKLDW